MNERIKKLRKTLGFTQQDFSNQLNIGRGTLANYEVGRNDPIDAIICLICQKFNVSETWLRTGKGEMFVPVAQDQTIFNFVEQVLQYPEDNFRRRFVSALPQLTETDWFSLERLYTLISELP